MYLQQILKTMTKISITRNSRAGNGTKEDIGDHQNLDKQLLKIYTL